MNLIQKILIPAATFFVITFVIMNLVFRYFFNENYNNTVASEIELKQADINNNINRISDKAVLYSASYSGLKTVKRGLQIFANTNNLDSASEVLGDKYNALSADFEKITGKKFELAFYSANGINLYRSWDNYKGDNVLTKQKIIKDAIDTKEFKKGVGNDDWGIAIFGITPVFGNNSQFLGVVETRFPIETLLKNTNITENEDMMILVSKQLADQADKRSRDVIMSNYNFHNYIPTIASEKFKIENIDKFGNNSNLSNVTKFDLDNYLYYTIPLHSYTNEIIGLTIFQTDKTLYLKNKSNVNLIVFIFGLIGLILTMAVMIILGRIVIKHPVRKVIERLNLLSQGETFDEIKIKTKDEISEINKSLNKLIKGYKRLSYFAKDIGEGNLDSEFTLLGDNDEIGISLLDMRQKLSDAQKAEKERKTEDEKRNWATKGLANFADILRQNTEDIEAFSTSIIRNLVNYVDANQGGLFILNDSDDKNKVLELSAAYAYDRKKFVDKTVEIGEGLVGTCAIEKETIYITDVPDNYVNITSGLGQANPRNILIIPLKIEEDLFGVIELASFTIFEKYQIEFVEKLAESIASSLSNAKINIVTAQLLEQSQQQQEEMKAQEEELRQNMEEMLATQEEAARKKSEIEGVLGALNNSLLVVEFDLEGNIIGANDKIITLLGFSNETDILGRNHREFYSQDNYNEETDELWAKIQQREVVSRIAQINLPNGESVWLNETYSPVLNDNGEIMKVLNISFDITAEKKQEQEILQQQEEMKS